MPIDLTKQASDFMVQTMWGERGKNMGTSSGGHDVAVKDEGVSLTSAATSLDFVGAGVTATNTGSAVTVTIPGATSGTNVAVKDEGSTLTSAATSIDFVGGGVTATNTGAAVTVTVPTPAPVDATYVTMSASGTLTNERVLTAGTNVTITDGGANGAATVSVTGTLSYLRLPLLGIQLSASPIPASGFCQNSDAYYYPAGQVVYAAAQTAGKVYKINNRKGTTTTLTPTVTIASRSQIIYNSTLGKMIISGSGGVCTLDPTTDTFSSVLSPTSYANPYIAYEPTGGYLYYTPNQKPARVKLDGTSQSTATDTYAGFIGRIMVVGTSLFTIEKNSSAAILRRYNLTSGWPATDASLTLTHGATDDTGFVYNPEDGMIWIGSRSGSITTVNPSTMTVSSTLTLSGVASTDVNYMLYDSVTGRIVTLDSLNKLWYITASSKTILGYTIPSNSSTTSGLLYDPDMNQVLLMTTGTAALQRFLA